MGSLVSPVAPVPLAELGRVHFTGIGGAGMSGIARIMIARGVKVSGSDAAASDLLTALAGQGADVHVGHAAENIDGADTLVVSTAIRDDNPELAEARRRGLRILHRAAALASVMLGRRGIAVAGTHGKTTTTSMITTILRHSGADPGYVIGGILTETGLGADDGSGARVRGRGRRERRLLPDARPRAGHRHQRGSRPPGQLRRPRPRSRRRSRRSPGGSPRAGC